MKSVRLKFALVLAMAGVALAVRSGDVTVTGVTASQRYPWNGLVDGEMRFSWTPDLNTGAVTRIYTVRGRKSLESGGWEVPVRPWHRFFKVEVAMPTGASDEETDVAGDGFVPMEESAWPGGVQLWRNGPYWAECNVGATKPEEFGYYFWWGDTVGYTRKGGRWTYGYYSDVTWVSSDGTEVSGSPFTTACPTCRKLGSTLLDLGYIDSTGNLAATNDAATAHLGAPWRMPISAEMDALISNCTTAWITTNGVPGRLVTGKGAYASKSIFLPAAGYGCESTFRSFSSDGTYWSSTPLPNNYNLARYLNFQANMFSPSTENRYFGQSVRPLWGFAR